MTSKQLFIVLNLFLLPFNLITAGKPVQTSWQTQAAGEFDLCDLPGYKKQNVELKYRGCHYQESSNSRAYQLPYIVFEASRRILEGTLKNGVEPHAYVRTLVNNMQSELPHRWGVFTSDQTVSDLLTLVMNVSETIPRSSVLKATKWALSAASTGVAPDLTKDGRVPHQKGHVAANFKAFDQLFPLVPTEQKYPYRLQVLLLPLMSSAYIAQELDSIARAMKDQNCHSVKCDPIKKKGKGKAAETLVMTLALFRYWVEAVGLPSLTQVEIGSHFTYEHPPGKDGVIYAGTVSSAERYQVNYVDLGSRGTCSFSPEPHQTCQVEVNYGFGKFDDGRKVCLMILTHLMKGYKGDLERAAYEHYNRKFSPIFSDWSQVAHLLDTKVLKKASAMYELRLKELNAKRNVPSSYGAARH